MTFSNGLEFNGEYEGYWGNGRAVFVFGEYNSNNVIILNLYEQPYLCTLKYFVQFLLVYKL